MWGPFIYSNCDRQPTAEKGEPLVLLAPGLGNPRGAPVGVFSQTSLSPHTGLCEEVKAVEGAWHIPRLGLKWVKYDNAHENRVSTVRPLTPSAMNFLTALELDVRDQGVRRFGFSRGLSLWLRAAPPLPSVPSQGLSPECVQTGPCPNLFL